jgi:hypothetical protein
MHHLRDGEDITGLRNSVELLMIISVSTEKDSEFIQTLVGTSFYGTIMQLSKKIPMLKLLAILFVPLNVIALVPKFYKMNRQAIQARIDKRDTTTHADFVDYMLPHDAAPPSTEKEKIHLEQVALQLFIAGFDPIRLLFYGSLFFLLKNPETYTALAAEIRNTFKSYNDITADNAARLQYLHACLQETLRVFPISAAGMPRKSPGSVVDGKYVPLGVRNTDQMLILPCVIF